MHRTSSRSGFTLYELVVVVSVIALLIGILLPSFDKPREEGRKGVIQSNLRSAFQELQLYVLKNMEYPESTEDFGKWLEQELPATFDWDEAEMRICIKGFDYELVMVESEKFGMLLCARPKPPKLSGSFVLCMDENGDVVEELPDEEALSLERHRTAVARARALHGIARIAGFEEDSETVEYLLPLLESSAAQRTVWQVLNQNDDQFVTVGELRDFSDQESGIPLFDEAFATSRDLLTIYDLDDGTSDELAISLEDYSARQFDAEALFSTTNIEPLMTGMFSSQGVQNSVLSKFEAAQSARERGDLETNRSILRAARLELEAQRDKSILSENADILISLTRIMSAKELPEE